MWMLGGFLLSVSEHNSKKQPCKALLFYIDLYMLYFMGLMRVYTTFSDHMCLKGTVCKEGPSLITSASDMEQVGM